MPSLAPYFSVRKVFMTLNTSGRMVACHDSGPGQTNYERSKSKNEAYRYVTASGLTDPEDSSKFGQLVQQHTTCILRHTLLPGSCKMGAPLEVKVLAMTIMRYMYEI